MEVQRVGKAGMSRLERKKEIAEESVSFSEFLDQGRDQKTYDKLTKLMQDIDDQGKVLAESRTVEDLREYKKMIKEFMDDAVKYGLKLEERRGFNRRGRTKVYKIVRQVDQKLLELTDTVLKQQEKGLKVLDLVGEIKGLLVNIYA